MKIRCFTLSVLVIILAVLFTGCGEEEYELDGVKVSKIQLDIVSGSDATFKFSVSNSSDEDILFDAGKFTPEAGRRGRKGHKFYGRKRNHKSRQQGHFILSCL